MINYIDYIGTFVFAISGIIAGTDRKFDLFGVFILGFVTAVGGGTLRDILIGSTPVGWMQNEIYIYIIMAALPVCYIWKKVILRWKKSMFLFDTIGIGLFTILGLQKTLEVGLSPIVAVMMGVVSAVFGGITRDVLSSEPPLIFQKEIYALACLAGAVFFLLFDSLIPTDIAMGLSIAVVIIIRLLAVRYHWSVPFNA